MAVYAEHEPYKVESIISKLPNVFQEEVWDLYIQENDVIEKPKLSEAPSNYAIIGRYILPMKILSVLKNQRKGKGGEIHITDAIKTLVKKNEKFYGNIFKGKYIDCGTLDGFVNSGLTISKYL